MYKNVFFFIFVHFHTVEIISSFSHIYIYIYIYMCVCVMIFNSCIELKVNETLEILWDFEIQTDHLIPARRPDLVKDNKKKKKKCKTSRIMDFAFPAGNRIKLKESEKRDKYLDLSRGLKKLWIINDSDTSYNRCTRYSHQMIGTGTGRLGNKRISGDHPNDRTDKISQNTEESTGNLRRHSVTQDFSKRPSADADVKNSQKSKIIIIIIIVTGGLENKRTSGDHQDNYIIEIGQNNNKSSGDLRRLAVTQTSVKTFSWRWCEKLSHDDNYNNK